jgi:hypothetical protein
MMYAGLRCELGWYCVTKTEEKVRIRQKVAHFRRKMAG